MIKFRLGLNWRTVSAVSFFALAAIASNGTAFAKSSCSVSDVLPSDQTSLSQLAAQCEQASGALDLASLDRATAGYNAARAYNGLGALWNNNSQAFDAYNKAKALIDLSRVLAPDASLAQFTGKKSGAVKGLRIGRSLEKARALAGLGPASIPPGVACASNATCQQSVNAALSELASVSPSPVETDTQFVDFYSVRAGLYSSLGQTASARQDLSRIAAVSPAAKGQLVKFYSDEVQSALRADPASTDKLRSAIATYPQAADNYPEVQVLLGKAYLRLASLEKVSAMENYRSADSIFQRAIASASSGDRTSVRADAYQGRGEALLGLGSVAEAISALQQSASLEPNKVERKVALGMAYARASYWTQADSQFESAMPYLTSWTGPKSDLVDALIKRAEVKRQLQKGALEVRNAYQDASRQDPLSPKPMLGIGKSLYEDGRVAEAETYFNNAIARSSALAPSDLAAAYHYRSLIRAKAAKLAGPKAKWQFAIDDADAAVRAGGSVPPFGDEACLIRVVATINGAVGACINSGTPEGFLLQGMAYLRSAQGAPALRSNAYDLAEQSFNRGLSAAQQIGALELKPNFKSLGYGEPPSLRVLLEYGKAKVTSCYGRAVDTPLTQSELTSATAFYADHRVDTCK